MSQFFHSLLHLLRKQINTGGKIFFVCPFPRHLFLHCPEKQVKKVLGLAESKEKNNILPKDKKKVHPIGVFEWTDHSSGEVKL